MTTRNQYICRPIERIYIGVGKIIRNKKVSWPGKNRLYMLNHMPLHAKPTMTKLIIYDGISSLNASYTCMLH